MNDSDKAVATFFGVVLGVLIIVPMIIIRALVLATLWEWFIVPLGVMNITIAHAVGLSSIFSLILSKVRSKEEESLLKSISHEFMTFIVVLVVGFIARGFM